MNEYRLFCQKNTKSQHNKNDQSKNHNYKVVVYPILSGGEDHQK